MNNKNRMTKTAGRLGRIIIFALVFALVSVVSITACACGVQAYADSTDSVRIVSDLASAGTATIDVSGNVSLPDLVYVNGTKTLKGNGTLQGTSSDYIIVVNSGASLTLEGVTVSGEGISGNGIYVSEDAAFVMKSGSVQSVKGVGVRVLGKASFNGGSISKAGENWLMLDTGASADVSALECTEAGAIGIITADGSSLTLGSGVSLTGSKGNLVYNGGKAAISGSSFGDAEDYAIHNDGELKISGTDFSGSKFLGYLENAETGDCTIEKSSMENSKADFIYNFGKLSLVNVEFDNCTSTAIESRGSKSEITVKDCKMDNIGKTAFLCKNGTLTIDKLEIAKCGGNGIHSRGCEVNGKDITIKECGAIGFLNDFPSDNDEAGVKSFTVDGFEIGHCVSYAIRSNGEYVINDSDYGTTSTGTVKSVKADEKTADTAADKTAAAASDEDDAAEVAEDDEEDEIKIDSIHDDDKTAEDTENVKEQDKDKDGKADKPHMTLSNGKVGKSDSYGLYVKGGDVILNNVKFLGTNDIGRAVIQVGYSKTPGGRLTLNEVDITGGKRGITNYSTLIMNSGNIHGNCIDNTSTSTGAGVYNAGTFIMNGGMIYGNACANSGGGVSNAKDAHFDMYGGIITQNTSGGYGGGVTNSGYFNLYNGTISKNISAKGGGGVRNACVAGLYGGVIKENKSEKSGGGLYCSTSDTCVSGVIIRDNTAGNYGGGIYNAGKMTVQGTASINANFAENNGAGIYNTGNTTMTSGRITGNTDGNKNCAIYLSSGEFTLTGGEVDSPAGDKFDVYLFGGTMNISGSPNIDKIKRRNTLYTNSDGKVFEIPTFNVAGALDVPVGSINLALSLKEGNPALNGDKNLISKYYDRFSLLNSKGVKPKDSTFFINHDVNSELCGYIDSETVAYVKGVKYSWEGALAAVESNGTIEIYRSFTVNDSAIDKNVIVTKHDTAGADCTITIDDDDSGDYAVTIKSSADVTFESININGGSRSAAAFYVASGSLTFDDCNLSGMNSSGSQGAAILVNTDGTLNLINGSIKNCYSAGSGAAVYNKGKTNVEGTTMSGNNCEPSKSGIVNGKDINNYNKSTLSLKNVTADDICLSNDATIEGNNIINRVFLYNISGGTNSVLIAKDSLAGSDIKIDVVEGQGSYPNLFVPGTVVVKADGEDKLTAETLSVFSLINNTDAKKVGDKSLIVLALNENETQGQLAINPELSKAILFSGRGTNHVNDKGEIVSNAVIATDGTIGDVLAKASAQTEECTVYVAKPVTYDANFTVGSNKTINFYGNISSSLSFDSHKLTVNGESHFNGIEILPHDDETTVVDNGKLCMSGINICSVELAPEKYITLDSSLSEGACVSVKVSNDYYVPGTRILSGSGVAESCSYIKMLNEPADKYTVGTDGCLGGDEATLFNTDGAAVKSGDIDELIIEAQDGYSIKLLRKNVTIDGKAMVGGEEKAIESTTIGENKGITFSGADSTYKIMLGADISTSSTLYFKTITFTGKDADKQQHTVKLAGAEGRLYGNGGTVNFIDVAVDGCSNSVILNHAPIYLSSTTSFNMTGGIIKNTKVIVSGGAISNSGISVLNGVTFDSCSAMKDEKDPNAGTKYGGAIYNTQDITLKDCSFSKCVAQGYGGAVYNKGTATISGGSISNSGFTGSKTDSKIVTTRGGAVCNTGILTVNSNAKLSGNQATNGGAIYNNGGTVTVEGSSEIIGNNATSTTLGGGAVYNTSEGTVILDSVSIKGNEATNGNGGAIYNTGVITVKDCTVGADGSANTSNKAGGAFYNDADATLNVSGSTLCYNTATTNGGGIYNQGSIVLSENNTISNNKKGSGSSYVGPDIYNKGTFSVAGVQTIGDAFLYKDDESTDSFLTVAGDISGSSIGLRIKNAKFIENTIIVKSAKTFDLASALDKFVLMNTDKTLVLNFKETDTERQGVLGLPEAYLYDGDDKLVDSGKLADMLASTNGITVKLAKDCSVDDISISSKTVCSNGDTIKKISANTDKVISVSEDAVLKNIEITADENKNAVVLTANSTKLHVCDGTTISQVYLDDNQTICADEKLTDLSSVSVKIKSFVQDTKVLEGNSISDSKNSIVLLDNIGKSKSEKLKINDDGKLELDNIEAKRVEISTGNIKGKGSLSSMINGVQTGEKVVLDQETIDLESTTLTIAKDVLIEGSAKTIKGDISISSGFSVEFVDFAVDGTVTNNGTFTANGATIKTLTETSGTVTVQNSASVSTLNQNGGTLNLNGVNATTVYSNNGTINISGKNTVDNIVLAKDQNIIIGGDFETDSSIKVTVATENYLANYELIKKQGTVTDKQRYDTLKYISLLNEGTLKIAPNGTLVSADDSDKINILCWDGDSLTGWKELFKDAVDLVVSGGVIDVIGDTSVGYKTISKNVTIFGNGYELTCATTSKKYSPLTISNNSTVTINNLFINKTATTEKSAITVNSGASLTVASGTSMIFDTGITDAAIESSGTLNLTGVEASTINVNDGTVNISGNNTISNIILAKDKSINVPGVIEKTSSIGVTVNSDNYINKYQLLKNTSEKTTREIYGSFRKFNVLNDTTLRIAPNGQLTNTEINVIRWTGTGKTGTPYKTLSSAITAAQNNNVIEIYNAVNVTSDLTTPTNVNFSIITAEGVTVTSLFRAAKDKEIILSNITATDINGSGNGVILYSNGGSIVFNSGEIGISTGESTVNAYNGSVTINGGTINGVIKCFKNGKLKITGGTINGSLSGTKAIGEGQVGIYITGGKFKNDPKDYLQSGYKANLVDGYYVVSAAPKFAMAKSPMFTVESAIRTLNNCATDEAVTGYLSSLTIDQLDELYNYVMNNIEAIEPPEGVDRGTRQYQLLNMIYDVKFSKGEGLYNTLFTYENQQDYLNTLTVKELAVLRAWVDAKQIEIGLSENDLFNLKALIDGTPYANIDNEEYLNKLDTDELQELRNYIIANNSEGDKTSEAGIDMTDKVDAVVEKKAAENLAKLEEAGTVKEPLSTESEGEAELTQEQKDAAAEEAKLQAIKDAWAAAQKYISSLSEEELKALGLYIDKLQADAYKAAQDAESAKTESDSAAVGEEATEEAKSAAAEKAKAAEEAVKAAEEAKKAAESAEVYKDAVAVAKAEKVIGNAKEGEFFADEVLTVLLSKETTAERFEVIKGYTLENMNKLLEVISKYDTTDFTEEERVAFEAVENLVRARVVELTPVNNDPA